MSHRPAKKTAATKARRHASLRNLLKRRFGFTAFRSGQEDIIRSVLAGHDTLAVLPTGAGKSLCYQLPALALDGTTVVVSPLISLMADQARKVADLGIATAVLNSTLSSSAEAETLQRIRKRHHEIVFVTPERLAQPAFIAELQRTPVDLLVIDEAHCISQWGHDFRPAFLEIAGAAAALGNPVMLALTATATPEIVQDICARLGRPRMKVIYGSVYRPNLRYSVRQITHPGEKEEQVFAAVLERAGSVIIYTATVKAAVDLHRLLRDRGIAALLYHGRLSPRERSESQSAFSDTPGAIMVATNAFGMGIDKEDVRAVIHYQTPASVEAYYQESGRAGRDGQPADCQLLFDMSDTRIQHFFLRGRYPGGQEIQAAWQALQEDATGGGVPFTELRSRTTGIAANKLRVALRSLIDQGAVRLRRGGRYQRAETAMDAPAIQALVDQYRRRAEDDRVKLEQLTAYAHSARCRWRFLLEYFGESPEWERCGCCDNCRRPPVHAGPVDVKRAAMPEGIPGAMHGDAAHSGAGQPPGREPFPPGSRVRTPTLGDGTVEAVHGETVAVVLDSGEPRRFLADYLRRA